jgi:hypothetical protein
MLSCASDEIRGLDWLSGLIELLQIVTTCNYSSPANPQKSIITTAHTMLSQFIFTSCYLVMVSNIKHSSAFVFTS